MAFLESIADDATQFELFRRWPLLAHQLSEYTDTVMRGPSPLTPAQRELIAAYVSAQNACRYCHGVHRATAEALGLDEQVFAAGLDDVEALPVDDALKPILRYVRKLTLSPAKMVQADADAVFAAGWDDDAFHSAISVCALFNLYNRIIEGHGIEGDDGYWRTAGARLADPERSYGETARMFAPADAAKEEQS